MYIYDSLTQDAKLPPQIRTYFTQYKRQALSVDHKALGSKLASYASAADLVAKLLDPEFMGQVQQVNPKLAEKLEAAAVAALQERHIQYYYENNYLKVQLDNEKKTYFPEIVSAVSQTKFDEVKGSSSTSCLLYTSDAADE